MARKTVTINDCDGCGITQKNDLGKAPDGWASVRISIHPIKRGRPQEILLCGDCAATMTAGDHPLSKIRIPAGSMAGIAADAPTDDD